MKGLLRSLGRGPVTERAIVKMNIPFNNTLLNVAATGAAIGFGNIQVGQFPEGHVVFHNAVMDLIISENSGNIIDTASGDIGLGTTANADTALAGTEVDLLASTAWGAMVASVAPAILVSNITPALFDFTAGPNGIFLNALIDAASITDDANGDLILNGNLTLSYQVLGDN